MITLEKIIKKEFRRDDYKTIVRDLRTTEFFSIITRSICSINKKLDQINNKNQSGLQFKIDHIVSSFLIKTQKTLRDSNYRKRSALKSLVLPLLRRLYIETLLSLPVVKRIEVLNNVEITIREIVFIFKFSYCQYGCFFRLNRFWLLIESNRNILTEEFNSFIPFQKHPGLVWNCKSQDSFNKFLNIISDFEISDPKNFAKLFDNPKQKLNIRLNPSDPEFVLQFLCCLKESKFISYYNTQGFYQVFRTHVKDFDSVFLKNRKPQRRIDTVKKLVTWPSNKDLIDKSFKRLL